MQGGRDVWVLGCTVNSDTTLIIFSISGVGRSRKLFGMDVALVSGD